MQTPEFVPTTAQEQNKQYRALVIQSPEVAAALEMWVDLTFKEKELFIDTSHDKDRAFLHAVEDSDVVSNLCFLLSDYLVFGKFVAHLPWDDTKGSWTGCIIHDLDYCSFHSQLFNFEMLVSIAPTGELQKWASSVDPRVADQHRKIDPKVLDLLASGEPVPLSPKHTLFLPRRSGPCDLYGTSWLAGIDYRAMSTAELLLRLGMDISKLKNDYDFTQHYVVRSAEMCDHITDYIFNHKMFPYIASQQGRRIPSFHWADTTYRENPRNTVLRAFEKLGTLLDELEAQQRQFKQVF